MEYGMVSHTAWYLIRHRIRCGKILIRRKSIPDGMAVVMVSDAAGYPVRHEYRMRLYACLLWYRGKDWAEQNVRDDQAEGYHAEWDTVIRYAATAPGALFSCKPGTNNLAPDCISPMIKRTYLSAGSASAACRSCAGTSLSLGSLRQSVQLHQNDQ
jgi:hypothetical protein